MSNPMRGTRVLVLVVVAGVAAVTGFAIGKRSHSGGSSTQATGQLWTCGMHPQVIQPQPGDCPICHMKLTPLKAGSPSGSTSGEANHVVIDPAVLQSMGVRTALVTDGPLRKSLRLLGTFEEAQPSIHDISLRVSGWIRKLYAASEGMQVEAGAPLFDLYSPDLQVAIEELIAAKRIRDSAGGGADSGALFDAANRRLVLLGLSPAQVTGFASLERAPESVTFQSPATGSILDTTIVEGAAVSSGQRVLRIVDHSLLWLDVKVFEKDLSFVRVGAKATATVESRPRNTYEGEVVLVYPHVDPMTRAGMARVEIRNAGLALKPGMYATVTLETELAERAVLVPREAVIDTGESQIAILALGDGRFEPRQFKIGVAGDGDVVQVISGLSAGDSVVVSGQFLLDSESRVQEAIRKFTSAGGGAATPDAATPGPRIDVSPAQRKQIDAVVAAYLAIWDAMGAEQKEATPVNPAVLIEAAQALNSESRGTKLAAIASSVAAAAEALRGRGIDQQREAFNKLSTATIALVDAAPPTETVGKVLYLMHCPMTKPPGNWLQDHEDLANPYYATDMKTCGETVRKIETHKGGNP